ncbi:hypothetical protein FB451DRAFT_1406043 [Mycena latifolia]|nr:hypothetical protein FB451DRAFT_1406043 [Mycena latifolia]
MSSAGHFVNQLYEGLFFEGEAKAISTYEADVAPDAKIQFNGSHLSAAQFLDAIKTYHTTASSKLAAPQENLAITPLGGGSAVVAHVVKTKYTPKGESAQNQVSVSIIKVEEKGGRHVVTNWVETQQNTPA